MVRKIYFQSKDKVSKHDELIDLETSKTAIVVDSPAVGFIEYLVNPGDSVRVGDVIMRIHDNADSIKKNISNSTTSKEFSQSGQIISRKAEEYLDKHQDLNIHNIRKRFVTYGDLGGHSNRDTVKKNMNSDSILDSLDANIPKDVRPISLAKEVEIGALTNVQSGGLISTIFYNIDDFSPPESDNLIIKSAGSFLPTITYEVSRLLEKYPMLNSYYEDNFIHQYKSINIGVALDIDDGLKVYTINNSNSLNLKEIEFEISKGVYSYFRKELITDQIIGSTFTITDLSAMGVSQFVPLVNYKQSAILGISSFDKKLNRVTLSMSFDHRVTEGKVVSSFLSDLSKQLVSIKLSQ